jgi:hypothetical protein
VWLKSGSPKLPGTERVCGRPQGDSRNQARFIRTNLLDSRSCSLLSPGCVNRPKRASWTAPINGAAICVQVVWNTAIRGLRDQSRHWRLFSQFSQDVSRALANALVVPSEVPPSQEWLVSIAVEIDYGGDKVMEKIEHFSNDLSIRLRKKL